MEIGHERFVTLRYLQGLIETRRRCLSNDRSQLPAQAPDEFSKAVFDESRQKEAKCWNMADDELGNFGPVS